MEYQTVAADRSSLPSLCRLICDRVVVRPGAFRYPDGKAEELARLFSNRKTKQLARMMSHVAIGGFLVGIVSRIGIMLRCRLSFHL
jgi:hypothetical protein